MTAAEFAKYLYWNIFRGPHFIELYYSPSMLDDEKWFIPRNVLRLAQPHQNLLQNVQLLGPDTQSSIYGYWSKGRRASWPCVIPTDPGPSLYFDRCADSHGGAAAANFWRADPSRRDSHHAGRRGHWPIQIESDTAAASFGTGDRHRRSAAAHLLPAVQRPDGGKYWRDGSAYYGGESAPFGVLGAPAPRLSRRLTAHPPWRSWLANDSGPFAVSAQRQIPQSVGSPPAHAAARDSGPGRTAPAVTTLLRGEQWTLTVTGDRLTLMVAGKAHTVDPVQFTVRRNEHGTFGTRTYRPQKITKETAPLSVSREALQLTMVLPAAVEIWHGKRPLSHVAVPAAFKAGESPAAASSPYNVIWQERFSG
ncbi:hypothetical protein L248_1965 [Schleiferilactobacillus shenzhenensis LY-73]|uniref:Uncharacterized protein n=1 Tax=Schleiferilactobacillus shenzhenensis LY-73 TaxID=1231336 RepID=U4TNW0_9LACO|nr:hypothetical protein L248_1965 [Schleiferilactobacillus shenzhenensis LY-73]